LAARRKQVTNTKSKQAELSIPPEFQEAMSVDDFGPIGKIIAGVTQIVSSTLLEYAGGFFGGLLIGTVAGVPGFLFRPIEPGVPKVLLTEVAGRLARMNTRSFRWAKNWGGISAAFGGFRVSAQVLRGGKQDEWNNILSSAAAGAWFARNGTFQSATETI
jgi:hypothetical protein